MLAKLPYFALKILLKLISFVDLIYTKFKFLGEKDPTRILCDLELKTKDTESLSKTGETHVSVIIPFKDKWELTKQCLKGLSEQKREKIHLEIILVDNGSKEKKTSEGIQSFIKKNPEIDIKVVFSEKPFNFSYLNNLAVKSLTKKPDYLWFLNNDISFLSTNSLQEYVSFALSKRKLGALGSTLLYGDQKSIQHSFVVPGIKIAGAHPLKGTEFNSKLAWFKKPRRVSAVTGASLFVSYKNFIDCKMFDEHLLFSCQDIDLCLKLNERNLENWTLTQTVLVHHESMSRSNSFFEKELSYFYEKWGTKLFVDYPKLSTWNEKPSYKLLSIKFPWRVSIKLQNKLFF